MKRVAMIVLWPSFLAAALAEGCFFALFDPAELVRLEETGLAPMAIYGIGFFLFWTLCALASMLTCYLAFTPEGDPPF
ncbi:hypothetical protein Q4S45_07045 [Massilia sp. R2A-15]|uniref:hypothetical protein n=1 Tax=Massilia sp. R2A-15 TaxID=3064278 RepID=UPI0027364ED2|nr:hypothetical protein [Massilia sp. R2A-15]WLI90866.1 hypothetical protein Q4S45_07045 [Massilia sp. R2A-15]